MEPSKTSIIIKETEELFQKAWKSLQELNPKYAALDTPSFKLLVNTKERFCKYGFLSCPTFMQFVAAKGSPSEMAKEFCEVANKLKEQYKNIKAVNHSKGYVNVEIYEQNALVAEESKEGFDPITSLYTTVAYNYKQEPTFLIKPIGYIESCFRERFGTPRQASLCKASRGRIVFRKEIQSDSFEGLKEFTHIWILFIFDQYIGSYSKFRAKNDCPKVADKKGVFATRSPCRFNPIGISPAKILDIDPIKNTIWVSGIDLVNGTHVIDIKPYIKSDIVAEAKFPGWLKELDPTGKVEFAEQAKKEVEELVTKGKLVFYNKVEDVVELIKEVLGQNPHSKAAIDGQKSGIFAVALDNMEVIYNVNSTFNQYKVVKVLECKKEKQLKELRTEPWLSKTKALLTHEQLL